MTKDEQIKRAHIKLLQAQDELRRMDQQGISKRADRYKYWKDRSTRLAAFMNELNYLTCPTGHPDMVSFGFYEFQNGRHHIVARCSRCKTRLGNGGQWIGKDKIPLDILDNLPVFGSYLDDTRICAVIDCNESAVELHHWAPKELFPDEAEQWPKDQLCCKHHKQWHDTVTVPLRKLRAEEGQR